MTMGNMALSQINDKIWLGSLLSLKAEKTLEREGVTHILSILGTDAINTDSQAWTRVPIFKQVKHHLVIDVEDLDDANLLQHFSETNAFMDKAIKANEGVLVHCAAGISRSVTCVCAYLMQANKWSPEMAISYVQARRPIANPNDGFRTQLQVYYDCGFEISDEAKPYREWKLEHLSHNLALGVPEQPVYTPVAPPPLNITWKHIVPVLVKKSGLSTEIISKIYQVSVDGAIFGLTEPVADALKSQVLKEIIFVTNDEKYKIEPYVLNETMKQVMAKMISFRCKGCSTTLASSSSIVRHETGGNGNCQHFFVEPVEWMRSEIEKGELEGKLPCPKCSRKVGSYLWQGSRCSCGSWITPSFKLSKAKVDEMATTTRPLL